MEREQKAKVVDDLKARVAKAAGVFVADYRGLNSDQVHNLRKAMRAAGVDYRVVKNTLLKRAVAGTSLEAISAHLKGMTAIAIATKDAVTAAKAAVDFAKANETFKLRGAFVEGQLLLADGIKTLSTMPTQAEMRATLLGTINAPAAKLLAQINAPGQQLAGVLQAKVDEDKKKAA
jgi:large subunit ribosomal protein L10